jgi:FtsP/CotA-like multicopper oxidase with cupredoxin domain
MSRVLDRRQVLRGATMAGGGLALSAYMPAWAQSVSAGIAKPLPTVSGEDITLRVAHQKMMIDGRESHAIGINGTVPAPLIRLREGQNVRLHVVNDLDEETSIHWHGLLVPFQMDGVLASAFPAFQRARPSPTNFRSSRAALTGITAIRGFRNRTVTTGRS